MLLTFTASNFKSILEPVTFSMVAVKEDPALPGNLIDLIRKEINEKVNSFSVIMGPNGSGKSSLIEALKFVKEVALREGVNFIPRNRSAQKDLASHFEVCFLSWTIMKYTLDITPAGVVSEKLQSFENNEWEELKSHQFLQNSTSELEDNELNVNWSKEYCDFDGSYSADIEIKNFFKNLVFFDSLNDDIDIVWVDGPTPYTENAIAKISPKLRGFIRADVNNTQDKFKITLINLLNELGINVVDLDLKRIAEETYPIEAGAEYRYISSGAIPSVEESENSIKDFEEEQKKIEEWIPDEDILDTTMVDEIVYYYLTTLIYEHYSVPVEEESSGTRRLIKLAIALLDAFYRGDEITMIIDEMDAGLHDTLSAEIVSQFFSCCLKFNRKESQLIVTSHNTVLLQDGTLRRDQIWLSEMKENRTTDIFSLAELKGVKSTEDFAENYLHGKYGALPPLRKWNVGEAIDE